MCEIPCLDDAPIGAAPTEVSTNASDVDGIMNTGDDFDCARILEDESVLNEVMVSETTCARPSDRVSVKLLSKVRNMLEDDAEKISM